MNRVNVEEKLTCKTIINKIYHPPACIIEPGFFVFLIHKYKVRAISW